MQVHNTTRIGSYCTLSTLTEMTRTWSEGKTIFPVQMPQPRTIDKDPSEMTLQELEDTQNQELPTISRQSWMLTGQGAWSTDKPSPTGRTIADALPDDHALRTGWKTTKPVSEMTAEEIRALERWYAENTRGTDLTPYKQLHPVKRNKIEWERWTARCSATISYAMRRNHSGVPTIEIRGKRTDDKEYEREAKWYLRFLRDQYGHVPTMEEIEEHGASIKAILEEMKEHNVGINAAWYEEVYLNGNHHEDPHNFTVFDEEYHSSYEFLSDPDLDIDEDFVRANGLDPEDLYDLAPRTVMTKVRSKRDRERITRNPSHNDATWHARIGQSTDLGMEFQEPRTFGRVVGHAVQNAMSKINDTTGISALSMLKD
jgi:hypothetical protein